MCWLQRSVERPDRHLHLGVGDDAALVVIRRGYELILTTDMSVEGVHFTRQLHPPRSVGHRALARSLSDIAAMGGTPRYALVSLALSDKAGRAWMENFYRGILALGRRFGVIVIGGDTAVVPGGTMIDVIVAGEIRRGRALRRSGAQPGDQLFVSGRLGLAALGLRLLKSPTGLRTAERSRAIQAHLYPEPRCALGRFLSDRRLASALIDLSDGLSTDLFRVCEASGVGARLWDEHIPAPRLGNAQESLQLALHGGEDYQLLFSVPQRKTPRIPSQFRGLPIHRIGEIERSKGLRCVARGGEVRPLEPAGWDYFRQA